MQKSHLLLEVTILSLSPRSYKLQSISPCYHSIMSLLGGWLDILLHASFGIRVWLDSNYYVLARVSCFFGVVMVIDRFKCYSSPVTYISGNGTTLYSSPLPGGIFLGKKIMIWCPPYHFVISNLFYCMVLVIGCMQDLWTPTITMMSQLVYSALTAWEIEVIALCSDHAFNINIGDFWKRVGCRPLINVR